MIIAFFVWEPAPVLEGWVFAEGHGDAVWHVETGEAFLGDGG